MGRSWRLRKSTKPAAFSGKKLELVSLDNKSEPSEAASAAQKLVDEGVVAMVAPNMSSNALAAVPITGGAKIPSISREPQIPRLQWMIKRGKHVLILSGPVSLIHIRARLWLILRPRSSM